MRVAVESLAQERGEVALEALAVVVGEGGRPLCASARASASMMRVGMGGILTLRSGK